MPASEEHGVAPDIRRTILARLAAIESEHAISVVYACESGSRAWGFASPDSDIARIADSDFTLAVIRQLMG